MAARDYKTYVRYSDSSYRGLELERLQQSGLVDWYTLPCLTQDILLHNIDAMVQQGHPIGNKLAASSSDDRKNAIEALTTSPVHDMLLGYLAEREVQPELTLLQSRSMQNYLNEVIDERVLGSRFDLATLKRSLPTLIKTAYDEAKEMIMAAVQEHAQAAQQARA